MWNRATHTSHPTVWLSVGREKEKPVFARPARAVLAWVVLVGLVLDEWLLACVTFIGWSAARSQISCIL
jgi:hypothetical protein